MKPTTPDRPLTTAQICDGARRIGAQVVHGPSAIKPLQVDHAVLGPALPVVHSGSVDVIFEAISRAHPGDVLLIDDHGGTDRASFGDLVALEATHAGVAGVILNGSHRDTTQVIAIGLPVFSLGPHPAGPRTTEPAPTDPFAACQIGDETVHRGDLIVADADGIVIIPRVDIPKVVNAAEQIREVENDQVERFHAGEPLRVQLEFDRYLDSRASDPSYDFYSHLQRINRAIE